MSQPSCHLEPIAGVLRIYAPGKSFENEDPYLWAATVRFLAKDTVEILGVDKPLAPSLWRAIRAFCEDDTTGITAVLIKRHGKVRTFTKNDKGGEG